MTRVRRYAETLKRKSAEGLKPLHFMIFNN